MLPKNNRVLLVSPDFLGLYKDVYQGLIEQGFNTDLVVTKTIPGDPYLVCAKRTEKKSEKELYDELRDYWDQIYKSGKYSFCYDYLIVIDGTCLHPHLFELLTKNNPQIIKINFLFDGIETVYRFDRSFNYFDKIYTFDINDSIKFNLIHLPIYWVKCNDSTCLERDIFAFGSYNETRQKMFNYIKQSIPNNHIKYFIKLYISSPSDLFHKSKAFIKRLLFPRKFGMITYKSMSTEDFRKMIVTSRIVVDTSNGYQDGLSARFMWALGLGRKIITNNKSVIHYSFYTREQIYIVGQDESKLSDFILSDFIMSDEVRKEIDKFRIDNWIHTLVS